MKKILLIILCVLGLSFSTQSMADVKNLPIICSPTKDINLGNFPSYILISRSDLHAARDKLMNEPKLILQQGFIDHEKIKLKCPSGSRKIKPFSKKTYKTNKLEIYRGYIKQLKSWSGKGWRHEEFEILKFLVYVFTTQTNVNYDKYYIGFTDYCYENQYWSTTFECLRYQFDKKQAQLNNKKFFEINWKIIEIPEKKINVKDLKKIDLSAAQSNIPNICQRSVDKHPYLELDPVFPDSNDSYFSSVYGSAVYEKTNKQFSKLIQILSEHPSLFFTEYFGFHYIKGCNATEPFEKESLKKNEYKFKKLYLKKVEKLNPEDKEKLKFLIKLFALSKDLEIPEYVEIDDKTRKNFNANYAALLGAYDELKNNETYRIVRTVSRGRLVLKILLALL